MSVPDYKHAEIVSQFEVRRGRKLGNRVRYRCLHCEFAVIVDWQSFRDCGGRTRDIEGILLHHLKKEHMVAKTTIEDWMYA